MANQGIHVCAGDGIPHAGGAVCGSGGDPASVGGDSYLCYRASVAVEGELAVEMRARGLGSVLAFLAGRR